MKAASAQISLEQRFTKAHPCPICGGSDAEPRGQGKRCYGFLSNDGEWAHCTREEYAGVLERHPNSNTFPHRLRGDCRCGERHDTLPVPATKGRATKEHIEATYDYRNADGELLYQVVRSKPKRFRQRQPDGNGGWIWNLNEVPRILYRLPELLATDEWATVYVAEGEKDADRLRALGLVSTTNPGGAGRWQGEFSECLRDRYVVILPHNDDPGHKHAEQVAASLRGIAASVKVPRLPGLPGKGGDVCDWLDNGGTVEKLERLAHETPEWKPESVLPFRTAREVIEAAPEEVEYYVHPWVAKGAITEIDGAVKRAGKSTFLLGMFRKTVDGVRFMDEPTAKTKVVYLTEQQPASFAEALKRADLLDRDDFVILHWHDTIGVEWGKVARVATDEAIRIGAGILAVDTLHQFAGLKGDDENDSGAALEAMRPLQEAAAQGLAVVIVRHERKGGGEVGESGRGSSAFAGAVDTILSIGRPDGNTRPTIRRIEALSRFSEVPAELAIELVDGEYRSLGTETAVATSEARRGILEAAPTSEGEAVVMEELFARAEVTQSTGYSVLRELVDGGKLGRAGKGVKGSPYRYWRPDPSGGHDDNIHSFTTRGEVLNERNEGGEIHSFKTPTPKENERKTNGSERSDSDDVVDPNELRKDREADTEDEQLRETGIIQSERQVFELAREYFDGQTKEARREAQEKGASNPDGTLTRGSRSCRS